MKIDLRKAYDMMSWEFQEEAMRGFGFTDKSIQWIMGYVCVSTIGGRYSVVSPGSTEPITFDAR